MSLVKEANYRPSQKEPFMNERQREYFRQKLLDWKEDILKDRTLQHLQDGIKTTPDLPTAPRRTDRAIDLRARDRQRKLIANRCGDPAHRTEPTACEETGADCALRLEARPIVTLSLRRRTPSGATRTATINADPARAARYRGRPSRLVSSRAQASNLASVGEPWACSGAGRESCRDAAPARFSDLAC
jgi:DnaK suppressor protein